MGRRDGAWGLRSAPELPAPPRLHERRAIWKDDRGRDVPEPLSVRFVTADSFGPMARYNPRLDVVDRDYVGATIAVRRRLDDEIGGPSR